MIEGRYRHDGLRDRQRLAARRDDPERAGPLEQRGHRLSDRPDDVLTAVDHEQHIAIIQVAHQRLEERPASLGFDDTEDVGDLAEHQPVVPHGREVDEPDATGKPGLVAAGDLDRQAGLAAAAAARQR